MNSLENIVIRVRALFDSRDIDLSELMKLYRHYNPVEDLDEFVTRGLIMFPYLCCGLASVFLKAHLGVGSIERGRFYGERHSFLLINGQTVVDITADQYGGPKIYIGPLMKPWELGASSDKK